MATTATMTTTATTATMATTTTMAAAASAVACDHSNLADVGGVLLYVVDEISKQCCTACKVFQVFLHGQDQTDH
jgi:hypothetical protein